MTELITAGEGTFEATADEAIVRVSVTGKGRDRVAAVADLRTRAESVERAVAADGVEVRHRNLWVNEEWKSRRRTGARAVLSLQLAVGPGDPLPTLLAGLVEAEVASLDGPSWQLADRTAAEREAQRLAVAAARTRAEGYAEACGMRLGPLLRLTDSPAGRVIEPMMYAATAARSMEVAQDIAELRLDPESVQVTAHCTATWQLLG